MLLKRFLPFPRWWQYYLGTVQCRQAEASLPQSPRVDLRIALPAGGRQDHLSIQLVAASTCVNRDPLFGQSVISISHSIGYVDVVTMVLKVTHRQQWFSYLNHMNLRGSLNTGEVDQIIPFSLVGQ